MERRTQHLKEALKRLDYRKKKPKGILEFRSQAASNMFKRANIAAEQIWHTYKFFYYKASLDWGTKVSATCAKCLGFPEPADEDQSTTSMSEADIDSDSEEPKEPEWWKHFRKFIGDHVSNMRGRVVYDVMKKMKSE